MSIPPEPCIPERPQSDFSLSLSKPTVLDGATAFRVAEFFKALSDPTRVRIIHLLAYQEMSVGEICLSLTLNQPNVSHQLRLLRTLRLVTLRKDGRHAYYSLADQHVRELFLQGLEHVQE